MSKSKKKKRKSPPPLSGLDKLAYGVLIALCAALIILIVVSGFALWHYIAFRSEDVVASYTGAGVLLILPFFLYLTISFFVVISLTLGSKKPIFGNKNIRYGQYPWPEDLYPLFDKRRKLRYKKPSESRFAKSMLRLWLTGLLLTFALTPFALFGRNSLYEDGSMSVQNAFNVESKFHHPENYELMTLRIYWHRDLHGSSRWSYDIKIKPMDAPALQFDPGDFRDTDSCLDMMLKLKAMFPESSFLIEGTENWEKLMDDIPHYSEEQTAKLRELFFGESGQ